MTFSIVARDPETGDFGVAVQSKFLAVGSAVPHARAGVGAVATQALANLSWGPRGLDALAGGSTAPEALSALVASDDRPSRRQAGIVDRAGRVAAHTGAGCTPWAGHHLGDAFACQGNILVSAATIDAMAASMEASASRPLAERLVAALAAGQAAGGDSRGQQSAGLLVVRAGGGYGGQSDRLVDLRVDESTDPIGELGRLLRLHSVYFGRSRESDLIAIDPPLAEEIAFRIGQLTGNAPDPRDAEALWTRLERWAGRENLEERMVRPGAIDPVLLAALRGGDPASRL